VDSLTATISDFYNRWAKEDHEAVGAQLHYFPSLDHIQVRISLKDYPINAKRTDALFITESQLYRALGAYQFETTLAHPGPYTPIIYWTTSLDRYLEKEYKLGDDLFLYCDIVALDHDTKTIVICAKDFTKESSEEIYKEILANTYPEE
jgi:hypothetical protein